MFFATIQLGYLISVIFTELFEADCALVDLHFLVVGIELLGLLFQKLLDSRRGHSFQGRLVLRYYLRLPRKNREADEHAEAAKEYADQRIKEKSNANHGDQHLIKLLILLFLFKYLKHPLRDIKSIAAKAEENCEQTVSYPDHDGIIINKANAHQVQDEAYQIKYLITKHVIKCRWQVNPQLQEFFAVVEKNARKYDEHNCLPNRSLINCLFVIFFYALLYPK